MSEVRITVTENGPLSVKGPFTLVDQDGNEYDLGGRKRVALCRCGASTTKPFCDGSHSRIGFAAAERAARGQEECWPAATVLPDIGVRAGRGSPAHRRPTSTSL